MENASKALIIAGSVLVALLIVSLGVLLFTNTSESLRNNAELDKQEIAVFNEQFLDYTGSSVSGTKVNALIELVRSVDNECISSQDYTKAVEIKGNVTMRIEGNKLIHDPRRVETGASKYYDVTEEYGNNGLINVIYIKDATTK